LSSGGYCTHYRVSANRWQHGISPPCRSCKQPPLRVSRLNTPARNVEILGFDFYADEFSAKVRAGDSGCAASHEGVENRPARLAADLYDVLNQFLRLLRWVNLRAL